MNTSAGADSLSSHLFLGKFHWDVWKILSTMEINYVKLIEISPFSLAIGPCWRFRGGLRVTNLQVYKTYTCEVVCNLRGHQSKVPPVW